MPRELSPEALCLTCELKTCNDQAYHCKWNQRRKRRRRQKAAQLAENEKIKNTILNVLLRLEHEKEKGRIKL